MEYSIHLHNIKNHLSTVKEITNFISKSEKLDDIKYYNNLIKKHLKYIEELNKELIYFTINNKIKEHKKVFKANEILKTLVEDFDLYIKKNNVNIILNLENARVHTYEIKLRNVLICLLKDAIKKSKKNNDIIISCNLNDNSTVCKFKYDLDSNVDSHIDINVVEYVSKQIGWDFNVKQIKGKNIIELIIWHITG